MAVKSLMVVLLMCLAPGEALRRGLLAQKSFARGDVLAFAAQAQPRAFREHAQRSCRPRSPYLFDRRWPCRCLQMTGGGESSGSVPRQPLVKLVTQLTGLFPFWVLGAGTLGFLKPASLGWLRGELVTFSLALTMLFMGMTLTVSDFDRVLKNPKQVFLGFICQFTIMPLMGLAVARVFQLPVPLAVGTILVACCPGGTASNLVTLIAKADVALSVLMTTVSTCAAPLMTPMLTSILAGSLVPVAAGGLVLSTLQVVIAPVVAGLVINTYFPKLSASVSAFTPLLCVILVALICGSVIGQTAASLVAAGPSLLAAVVSLHLGGFVLGYTVPKVLGYPAPVSRTVAIETGMQNSALGVVLATKNFADPLTALPCAISATCHSLIGSAFASYWRGIDESTGKE